ncbi:hypothetical protein KL928_000692 [Ogataea angusta]|uniref:Choline/carnitine acyltransferase domain-containing protein n=1 Tax=Pichia angusta TaxID=870730 RepID=A0AAN6I836_PICAN|nr:uncharacterized protein KL928_000692 [Ogataea angusta]KAG7822217.1 hypothetical protein KL928_000692 [Ogataea angusta]
MSSLTFQHEAQLPQLPVPALLDTVDQALKALKPLVSADEYRHLEEKSFELLNSDIVQLLQQHLLESSKLNHNYLESEGISPTTANVYGDLRGHTLPRNPFFIFEDDPLKSMPPTQAFRASILVTSALRFIVALRQDLLAPDTAPKSKQPLSMSSYHNLFGTTIVPFNNGVTIKRCTDYQKSRHIVVMARSQFYVLEVLSEDHQIWFSKHELKEILLEIMEDSKKEDQADVSRRAIGSFTTELKSTWKHARSCLERSNQDVLDVLDNALFVVSLDHEAPTNDLQKVQYVSHGTSRIDSNGIQVGTCTNRYYDKLNLVITENSVAACVYPAACMDGTTVLRFVSDIYTDSVLRLARKINGTNYTLWKNVNTVPINSQLDKPTFQKLEFELTPELRSGLHLAETRLADIIHQHEYVSRTVTTLGNSVFANKLNLPGDSIVQLAIQITYYALYGKSAPTLEPVSTRKFRDARTEPICIQSEAVLALCQAFISQTSGSQKWNLLLDAVHEHSQKIRNASRGQGFERHLSALRSAFIQLDLLQKLHPNVPKCQTRQVPPFLFEPALDNLYKPELLVANCGNPALHLFGVTPAIPTGFGIGYIIKDDMISIVASSQWRQTDRFLETLESVFDEIKSLWKEEGSVSDKSTERSRARELESYAGAIPKSMLTSNYTLKSSNILGGYDYFDVNELAARSGNSTAMHSSMSTRSNSAMNIDTTRDQGVGKRIRVNED